MAKPPIFLDPAYRIAPRSLGGYDRRLSLKNLAQSAARGSTIANALLQRLSPDDKAYIYRLMCLGLHPDIKAGIEAIYSPADHGGGTNA